MGNNQGKPRSKGQNHPIGFSGRTLGAMIRAWRPPAKEKKK